MQVDTAPEENENVEEEFHIIENTTLVGYTVHTNYIAFILVVTCVHGFYRSKFRS